MLSLQLGALFVFCLALASIVWSSLRLGISPMPTSPAVRRELLKLIPSGLQGEVHELGAGWGTLAWAVASQCPSAQVIAWEMSLIPYLFCRLRLRVQPRRNLTLRHADFFDACLKDARLVITYLWTGAMSRLAETLFKQLPEGSMVISNTFAWRGNSPWLVQTVPDVYRTRIYLYRIDK